MIKRYAYKYIGLNDKEIEAKLHSEIIDALHKKYGANPDLRILKQVREEWEAIKQAGLIKEVAFLDEFTFWLRKEGYSYQMMDETAGSLILYLLKVTAPNPLPAHLYCEQCHTVQWMPEHMNGFDIPPDHCDFDGCKRYGDGHNLVWQFVWKYYKGDKGLFFMLIPYLFEDYMEDFLANHWLRPVEPVEIDMWDEETDTKALVWGKIQFSYFEGTDEMDYDMVFDARCMELAHIPWLDRQFSCRENGFIDAMKIPQPKTFAELIIDYELVYSPWLDMLDHLFRKGGFSAEKLLIFTEDVFNSLMKYQYSENDAMEMIRGCGEDSAMLLKAIKEEDKYWVVGNEDGYFWRSKALGLSDLFNKICLIGNEG